MMPKTVSNNLNDDRIDATQQAAIQRAHERIPVKLSSLAKDLGLRVIASTLPPGISGEIRPIDGRFVISVNRHDSARRQRFTVAHEIAHFLLHRDQIGSGIADDVLYRSSLSDSREAEANRLAADILLPRQVLSEEISSRKGRSREDLVSELAEMFDVSEVAMKIRLGIT
ncbi:ImmA/IrrE family metallo-endopeptidase [Arenimonas sp. MALMAid1274]|uniref:ImmA/IrrE family metallo-endopeptidase n=1 Tax=Arenimonas sp. MALMAid1274 TaxID=3411630 RepID=UPI003B9FDB5F